MYKSIYVLIRNHDSPFKELIRVLGSSEVFNGVELQLGDSESFDLSQVSNSLILSFGKNRISDRFIPDTLFANLSEDGYFIHTFTHGTNDLVILGANRLRSLFYAAWDLVDTIQNKSLYSQTWLPIDKQEDPAFPVRMRMHSLYFSADFPKSCCGIVRNVMARHEAPEQQREALLCYIMELLRQRFNTIVLASYGMDLIVDFEAIGFPEIYGDDEQLRLQRQRDILAYQKEVKHLIDVFHEFDIRVDIHHCGIIGFSHRFPWVEANFFAYHPEAEAQPGRDDPSINWHDGTNPIGKRFWCPSQTITWTFVESYYKALFSALPIEQFTILSGDCDGSLHCGCDECRNWPYKDRVKKLNQCLHSILIESNPRCLLVHRNDDFIPFYPNHEADVENHVIEGLSNAIPSAKWAQPMNFDFGTDWRIIYMHPLLGRMKRLYLMFWYGWIAPVYNMFLGQHPHVYREQMMYAVSQGVTGVSLLHEAYDDRKWLSEPLFYNPVECKLLEPYHFDMEAQVQCTWNPFSFDVDAFWKNWCVRYFANAGVHVYRAFQVSTRILDVLGRWDVGDYCGGGLPPFSYMDRIWQRDDLEQIASDFYIRVETLNKQASYTQNIKTFDATDDAEEMLVHFEKAIEIDPDDRTLRRWFAYAKDTHKLTLTFRLYHEAYFLKRKGEHSEALKTLKASRSMLQSIETLPGYGETTFPEAYHSVRRMLEYYEREIQSQIQQIEEGKDRPYDSGDHWKAGACQSGERRDCYIYNGHVQTRQGIQIR